MLIELVGRVFANGRLGFNPRSSHSKDSKIIADTALLNAHKVWV